MRTAEDKAARIGRIGSTGIAALTGHSPWCRPIDVYRQAVEGHEVEQSEQMLIGDLLEDDTLELYARKTGREIARPGQILHPNGFSVDTPDAVSWLGDYADVRAVEAKTCVGWKYDEWGEPGTDEVPAQYLIQNQWHLLHLRTRPGYEHVTLCDTPVLVSGCRFAIYTVAWDAELAGSLMEVAAKFHRDHIVPRRPPPVDDSQSYSQFLRDSFPIHRKAELKTADPERAELLERLALARKAKADAERWQREEENRLKAWLEDAEGVETGAFRVTWKAQKDGKRVLRFKDLQEGASNGE